MSRSAVPRSGGIEAHLDRVARGLASGGHHVRIWAARIDDDPFTRLNTTLASQRFQSILNQGVQTSALPLPALRRALMAPSALSAIPGADRLGYDRLREASLPLIVAALGPGFKHAFAKATAVHAWGGEPLMHAAARAARKLHRPFVITPFAHPGHWGDDALNTRLYKQADRVVALLDGEARFYESVGVDPGKITVIGVGAPEPHSSPTNVRDQRSIEGPLVLCLGVKRPYKYRALLNAIPNIPGADVRFAFVGPETPESEADFKEATDPRILRAGKVGEAEKWGWLHAADVLCLPSVSEILPVSILEAWRIRTPVVVAEGRFTQDLVSHGEDGIVSAQDRIADAVTEALANPDLLTAMGRAGAAKVAAHYEPAAIVAAHEELYRTLA